MEIKSEYFSEYLSTKMKEIPTVVLAELIDEFASNAKFYMNSDIDALSLEKINTVAVDLLRNRFGFLPLNLVAEAYSSGSLGELGGTTRFTVRNIYIWLSSIEEKQRKLQQEQISKTDQGRRAQEERVFKSNQTRNNMYGAAMLWKIGYAQTISSSDYDLLTLDRIVVAMERGHSLTTLKPSMIL